MTYKNILGIIGLNASQEVFKKGNKRYEEILLFLNTQKADTCISVIAPVQTIVYLRVIVLMRVSLIGVLVTWIILILICLE